MRRLAGSLLLLAGFAICFGASIGLQSIQTARMRKNPQSFRDWLYIPSSPYVRVTSAGYDHFMADFLWLRVIQSFGEWYAKKEDIPRLMPYFDVITDLDPQFLDVYSFGNMVIGEDAGDHAKGLQILDKGIQNNPNKYRPAYEGAFFSFWTMNDPNRAKYYVARALKAPDCPSFVRGWTAYFEIKMGRYIAGYESLFRDYARFYNEGNVDLTAVRRITLRRAIRDWVSAEIRNKAIEFRAKNGRYPSAPELESARAFADVDLPDWARLRGEVQALQDAGEALPDDYDKSAAFARRFIRKGWTKLPADPASDNPRFQGFLIWPGQEPTAIPPGGTAPVENRNFCLSELEAAKIASDHVATLNAFLSQRKKADGGVCPGQSFIDNDLWHGSKDPLDEPWGGRWVFDPNRCEISSSSHPNVVQEYYQTPNL